MRKSTTALIEAMDEGTIDPRTVANACLVVMAEDEVEDMIRTEELLPEHSDE